MNTEKEFLIKRALQYTSRIDLLNNDYATFMAIKRLGILDVVTHKLESGLSPWLLDYDIKDSGGDYGYRAMEKLAKIKEAAHRARSGIHKYSISKKYKLSSIPATLYVIKLFLLDDVWIKIGFTRLTVEERIKSMRIFDHSHEIITKVNGQRSHIIKLETALHRHYAEKRYTGSKIMDNGNTELFHPSILESIDEKISEFLLCTETSC